MIEAYAGVEHRHDRAVAPGGRVPRRARIDSRGLSRLQIPLTAEQRVAGLTVYPAAMIGHRVFDGRILRETLERLIERGAGESLLETQQLQTRCDIAHALQAYTRRSTQLADAPGCGLVPLHQDAIGAGIRVPREL